MYEVKTTQAEDVLSFYNSINKAKSVDDYIWQKILFSENILSNTNELWLKKYDKIYMQALQVLTLIGIENTFGNGKYFYSQIIQYLINIKDNFTKLDADSLRKSIFQTLSEFLDLDSVYVNNFADILFDCVKKTNNEDLLYKFDDFITTNIFCFALFDIQFCEGKVGIESYKDEPLSKSVLVKSAFGNLVLNNVIINNAKMILELSSTMIKNKTAARPAASYETKSYQKVEEKPIETFVKEVISNSAKNSDQSEYTRQTEFSDKRNESGADIPYVAPKNTVHSYKEERAKEARQAAQSPYNNFRKQRDGNEEVVIEESETPETSAFNYKHVSVDENPNTSTDRRNSARDTAKTETYEADNDNRSLTHKFDNKAVNRPEYSNVVVEEEVEEDEDIKDIEDIVEIIEDDDNTDVDNETADDSYVEYNEEDDEYDSNDDYGDDEEDDSDASEGNSNDEEYGEDDFDYQYEDDELEYDDNDDDDDIDDEDDEDDEDDDIDDEESFDLDEEDDSYEEDVLVDDDEDDDDEDDDDDDDNFVVDARKVKKRKLSFTPNPRRKRVE